MNVLSALCSGQYASIRSELEGAGDEIGAPVARTPKPLPGGDVIMASKASYLLVIACHRSMLRLRRDTACSPVCRTQGTSGPLAAQNPALMPDACTYDSYMHFDLICTAKHFAWTSRNKTACFV